MSAAPAQTGTQLSASAEPLKFASGGHDQLIDFFGLTRDELERILIEQFQAPAYRAGQIFQWVYKQGVYDFSQMTNISAALRNSLAALIKFPAPLTVQRQISKDGTRKYLFELDKGNAIEAVMIKQPARMTLCLSSQVGCGMGCTFCRTATMGFQRHLSAGEIMRQVRGVIDDAKQFGDKFSNVVFMGMGEPLHNLKGVVSAVKILTDPMGLGIGPRKITVSTSGLVPAIEKFGQANLDVNLAVSLNATTDEVRTRIMPVNKAFPIDKLLGALRSYPLKPRKKITIEYVMLHGINDTDADLRRLPRLLEGIPSKVNLIPYNPNAGLGFLAPPKETVQKWHSTLTGKGVDAFVRWSKGQDISAACGQLAVKRPQVEPMDAAAISRTLAVITESI